MRVAVIASLGLTLAACSTKTPTAVSVEAAKVPQSANPFTAFETLQTRPLALSPSGHLLFAANTPDNRLEIFSVGSDGSLTSVGSVVVGLEPIAVAARSEAEVWVVNHLSDSVSIVKVGPNGTQPHVVRTLNVGDEPRDIVFAGPYKSRAFITTAHRGQNDPSNSNADVVEDPQGNPNSVGGRADVWVFDANNLGTSLGGDRFAKLTLFADTPRALAASADGSVVYAAAFFSGNMTTTVSVNAVRTVYSDYVAACGPGGNTINWKINVPGVGLVPMLYPAGSPNAGQPVCMPTTGLVVKGTRQADGSIKWVDAVEGRDFSKYTKIDLADLDVFAINANADAATMQQTKPYVGVGTTLFNMAVNPVNGKVYVSNTDAHNDVRFEGPIGAVTGRAVDSRITVLDPSTGATTFNNLNNHLPSGPASLSRAFPQDLTVSSNGAKLYVVAQGSAKLAVYDTAALESGAAVPTTANQVLLSAGGPTGVALDEKTGHAYVLTRFDNGISTVDTSSLQETKHVTMYNPEPANVVAGRPFLYDATNSSAHGDQACASCHVGGDFDGLAWDLGNPLGGPLMITGGAVYNAHLPGGTPNVNPAVVFAIPPALLYPAFGQEVIDALFSFYAPMKGPMTTQSLRGLDNHGALHWRGDRNGSVQQSGDYFRDSNGVPVVSAQPDSGIFDEEHAFESFNVAFPGLNGRSPAQGPNGGELTDDQMAAFTHFILDVTYPPNPIRSLNDALTPDQQAGHDIFFAQLPDGSEAPQDRFHNCNGCHTLDPYGNNGVKHPGFFGTSGKLTFETETQIFKVAHLRNLYQKVGRFSTSPDPLSPGTLFDGLPAIDFNTGKVFPAALNPKLPVPSVRGFGFVHDGFVGDLQHFFMGQVFIQVPVNPGWPNTPPVLLNTPTTPNPLGIPMFAFDPVSKQQLWLDLATNQLTTTPSASTAPLLDASGFKVRKQIVSFLFAFDSNQKPVVGQQVTLTPANAGRGDVTGRIALLEAQAAFVPQGAPNGWHPNCDLVVKGIVDGHPTGYTYDRASNAFLSSSGASLSDAQLRALIGAHTDALTFTAVPPGSGWRIGVDRDGDGNTDSL